MPVEMVDDPADPRLADFRDLPGQSPPRGILIAEGRLVVRTLLGAARVRARSVVATAPALEALRDVLAPEIRAYVVPRQLARALVGYDFHRGCLAAGELREDTSPDSVAAAPGARLLLLLERVTSPDNLGAIFRNAAAFGADGVVLSPGCSDPLYRRAVRTSMGAVLTLPFARSSSWTRDLASLRAAGFTLIALTPSPDAEDIATLVTPPARLALLLGTEAEGLGAGALAAADLRVRIPMAAGVDSLNVATACGIALERLGAARRR
jgi:tRNA G18 (ribose-2'-O)-methylase SpoU